MRRSLVHTVRRRAGEACEYCRMPQALYEGPFEIEHVVARQHHGTTLLENLALACPRCNRFKGPNLAGIDAQTGRTVRLFHPRKDRWNEHFAWRGAELVGLTATGRVTISVLMMNDAEYVRLRGELARSGLFPSGGE